MDDTLFNDLLASTKEAKETLAKKTAPSRTFYVEEPNAKEIRTKYNLTQNEFAKALKYECSDT